MRIIFKDRCWVVHIPFVCMVKFIIIIIIIIIAIFPNKQWLMVFHWSLNEGKSVQVPRSHLSILVNLSVVWMVSTRPLIFSSPTKPLGRVPNAPRATGIISSHSFNNFLCPLARSKSWFLVSFHLFSPYRT